MEMKVYLNLEEVKVAVGEYLKLRQPELMKDFNVSDAHGAQLNYDSALIVTLSDQAEAAKNDEPEVEVDEGKQAQ